VSRIQYDFFDRKFSESFKDTVAMANTIIREYTKAGFDLTLRQLYYQFVARGYIKNKDTEYKRLGGIINDGRLAGMIDWDAITDRTRYLRQLSHWDKPEDVIRSAACSYRTRKWADQPERVEVWIEKDALIGVIQPVCESLDVPYFSCRGYVSQSEMWAAAQRIQAYYEMYGRQSQRTTIIHLGDHDPSGIDMTRDIEDRISLFLGNSYDLPWKLFDVQRIALNMGQVELYSPPPNPAKLTDSRCTSYLHKFGRESWELDALDPRTIDQLIRDTIYEHMDISTWEDSVEAERKDKEILDLISGSYEEVAEFVQTLKEEE
jgi:hypothetical protein